MAGLPSVGFGGCAARAGENLVQPTEGLLVERDLQGPQRPGQLVQRPGPDDRGGHRGLVQQPGQRDPGRVLAEVGAERLVGLDLGPDLLDGLGRPASRAPPAGRTRILTARTRAAGPARIRAAGTARARSAVPPEHPAQHPAVQRAPRDDPDAVSLAGGQHLQLDRARREVVQGLLAYQPEHRAAGGSLLGLGDVPAREVRRAHVNDLALGAQDVHGLPDLVPRRAAVHVVHLVQVDVVGPQPAQRLLTRPADIESRQETVVGPLALAAVQLGGQHRAVPAPAPRRHPPADDRLGDALGPRLAIGVGGVEEVDAVLMGGVHDDVGIGLAGDGTEIHGAKAEPAHGPAAAAEVRVVHAVTLRQHPRALDGRGGRDPIPSGGMAGYDDDLRFAHVLADAADDITTRRFRALDLRVEAKPDLTPVTDADKAAEESLRNVLRRSRPRDAVLGEEFGRDGGGPRCWVIDPIDGTKNYVRGVPVWATLIGLMDGDQVVMGVVSAPALVRRWWAASDNGAWTGKSLTKATRCRVSDVRRIEDASFSYSSPTGWEERGVLPGFLDLTRSVWRSRAYGDFWSHVLVAEGAVDLPAEPKVKLWDLAAVQIIVEEAGGVFTDLEGNARPDGGSVVCTNARLHQEGLDLLASPGP